MSNVRKDRVEASISRNLSLILRDEVKDPALRLCTVTQVSCSSDLSVARVYVMFTKHPGKGMQALERSKGFIRSRLAKSLDIRKCPELIFKQDDSLDYGNHIEDLIRQMHEKK